jgi:hypothetical protein
LEFAIYPFGPCLVLGACDLEFAECRVQDAAVRSSGLAMPPRLGFAVYPFGPCLLFGACGLEFAWCRMPRSEPWVTRPPRLGFAVYPFGPCLLFGACGLEFAVWSLSFGICRLTAD